MRKVTYICMKCDVCAVLLSTTYYIQKRQNVWGAYVVPKWIKLMCLALFINNYHYIYIYNDHYILIMTLFINNDHFI